jgi:hypothetical protein
MTDQPIPVCLWCGAAGGCHSDCVAWECGSHKFDGDLPAYQSPRCKDRVIAKQAAEIEQLKADNTELRWRLGRMLSLAYLAASEGYRERLQPVYDDDCAYLKQSEVKP